MSVRVLCDLCTVTAPAVRLEDGDFSLPNGWRTPSNDNDRRVYSASRCEEVCSFACERRLFEAFLRGVPAL